MRISSIILSKTTFQKYNSNLISFIHHLKISNMKLRTIGIVMIILGIIMLIYTSFNYVTTEKLVDIGPIQINQEVNHPINWSPIVGIVLAVGGVVLLIAGKKQ